jgi:phospholipid/cholesterol/gamma-HCH transport system ATP-binding protein
VKNASPDLEFRGVWKQFDNTAYPTLAGIDLHVMPESIHVIIGYSGAGKSVSLRHALGLLKPDSGDVLVKGRSITHASEFEMRDIRMNFGMLFQSAALFDSFNVYDNIAFPIREHERSWPEAKVAKRVRELLDSVDLKDVEERMPSELSGGMRKRVGLARAIALHPNILLFDEPTTGLDPVTSQIIDDLIVKTTRNLKASAMIISHDMRAAMRIADSISMIWQGKIIETAAPKDLVKSKHEAVRHFLQVSGVI